MENISFLDYPLVKSILFFLKILFILIFLLLLFFTSLLLLKTKWIKFRLIDDIFDFFQYKPFTSRKLEKQWKKIKIRLESGLESEYKLAVIEADAVLEEVFKKIGYQGETMGEILEKINESILPDLLQIRQAHKIRNNIVYDPDYKLSLDEAKNIILIYEKTLSNLGAL